MSEGVMWDAPNQQVVRADQSPPWEEGNGGGPDVVEPRTGAQPDDEPQVDEMTKAQLLEYAEQLGVDVDDTMTKAEIRAEIDAAS